ncbi:50S ribosomal protein L25/general stress protein Ctc [Leucothrix sargassi]|nr:50S ribosomal protein L25/general stress protein Ctc [Leucothrix sargassi]
MADTYTLDAVLRTDEGKGASRRLRRTGKVPAVVYGGAGEPVSVSLAENQLVRNLQEEQFYSSIIDLNLDGSVEKVLLRDLQRHPSRPVVLHADLLRVNANEKINVVVQLHFVNEDACVGVKQDGGKVTKAMMNLEVNCLPADIPEFVEVDVIDLKLGESIHISNLTLPEGVESTQLAHGADHDLAIATVSK